MSRDKAKRLTLPSLLNEKNDKHSIRRSLSSVRQFVPEAGDAEAVSTTGGAEYHLTQPASLFVQLSEKKETFSINIVYAFLINEACLLE